MVSSPETGQRVDCGRKPMAIGRESFRLPELPGNKGHVSIHAEEPIANPDDDSMPGWFGWHALSLRRAWIISGDPHALPFVQGVPPGQGHKRRNDEVLSILLSLSRLGLG